jgi:GNAT superfamily N-acetyltransferase
MTSLPPDVAVRRARPVDLAALAAFVARCSADTLHRRFHGAGARPVRRELARIAAPTAAHRSWVAVTTDGQVHGTATLAWSRSGTTEAAFLVEDAWQRRGLGRALFAAVAGEAARAEVDVVVATVQADNDRAVRFLRAVAPGVRPRYVGGAELDLSIPVAAASVAPAPASASVPASVARRRALVSASVEAA